MYIVPAPLAPVPIRISLAEVLAPVPMYKSPVVCPAPSEISPVCPEVPPMVRDPDVRFEPIVMAELIASASSFGVVNLVPTSTERPRSTVVVEPAVPMVILCAPVDVVSMLIAPCCPVPPIVRVPDVRFDPIVMAVSYAFASKIGVVNFVSTPTLYPYKVVYEYVFVPMRIPIF